MVNILLVSFLVIIWWIALWGLVEIVLKSIVGNSVGKSLIAYGLMIAFVIIVLYMYPRILERFL